MLVVLAVAFGVAAGGLPGQSGGSAPDGDGPPAPPAAESGGGSGASELENPVSRSTYERVLAGVAVVALAVAFVLAPAYRRSLAAATVVFALAAASYAWFRPEPDGVLGVTATVVTTAARPATGVLALVALAAITAFAWRARRDGEDAPSTGTSAPADDASSNSRSVDAPHPATVAASNDVARAWQRAVREVEVSAPAVRTPGEFVRAGTEDVADADAFERLTAVFRRVRYGDADADAAAEDASALATAATADGQSAADGGVDEENEVVRGGER